MLLHLVKRKQLHSAQLLLQQGVESYGNIIVMTGRKSPEATINLKQPQQHSSGSHNSWKVMVTLLV